MASDEERLETLQIIQNQLAEVDDALAVKLLRQAEISDENHLEQEIQILQERINKTRQKMAASSANPSQVNEFLSQQFFFFIDLKYILLQESEPKKPNETAEFQEWLEGIRKQRYLLLLSRT